MEIRVEYTIPEHLKGIHTIDEMRAADCQKLDEELHAKGSSIDAKIREGVIWRLGFPSIVLNARAQGRPNNAVALTVVPIHPHRADLAYKGDRTLRPGVAPLTVSGILLDDRGDLVLGIRGGTVEAQKVGIIPAGHANYDFSHPSDLIMRTLINEAEEEISLEPDEVLRWASLTDLFVNMDTNGLHVSYTLNSGLPFTELERRWQSAKDRYEHEGLFSISLSALCTALIENCVHISQGRYTFSPFSRHCLKNFLFNPSTNS